MCFKQFYFYTNQGIRTIVSQCDLISHANRSNFLVMRYSGGIPQCQSSKLTQIIVTMEYHITKQCEQVINILLFYLFCFMLALFGYFVFDDFKSIILSYMRQ